MLRAFADRAMDSLGEFLPELAPRIRESTRLDLVGRLGVR